MGQEGTQALSENKRDRLIPACLLVETPIITFDQFKDGYLVILVKRRGKFSGETKEWEIPEREFSSDPSAIFAPENCLQWDPYQNEMGIQ